MGSEETPIPSVKDGLTSPVKETDAAILNAMNAGKAPHDAVKAAGMSMTRKSADAYVTHIKNKYADSQGGLLCALENVGVSFETVAGRIKDGLSANRTTKSGKDIIHVPDHTTRHKFVETTLDIMGARAPKHHVVESHHTHEQTVTFVDKIRESPDALMKIRERLLEQQKEKTIEVRAEVVEDDA